MKARQVLYLHPLQQGLKLTMKMSKPSSQNRFFTYIHYNKDWNSPLRMSNPALFFVLYLHPLQQGLKLHNLIVVLAKKICSLLTSITTRIETRVLIVSPSPVDCSLLTSITTRIETGLIFLVLSKILSFFTYIHYNKDWNMANLFAEISPCSSSLLTSITTRIETLLLRYGSKSAFEVLYLHPLQQGLKQNITEMQFVSFPGSLLTSITTRIETPSNEHYN